MIVVSRATDTAWTGMADVMILHRQTQQVAAEARGQMTQDARGAGADFAGRSSGRPVQRATTACNAG